MPMFRPMLQALLCATMLAGAAPALAQSADALDKRVGKLESEMRAVQRKVFPGGDKRYFEPEFQPANPAAQAAPAGVPASSPIADLTARVDALERQLATMTGQAEQNAFRVRQLEEALNKFRADAEYRLTQLEGGTPAGAAPAQTAGGTPSFPFTNPSKPAATPITPPAAAAVTPDAAGGTPAAATPAKPADPVEADYQTAYAFITAKQNVKAQEALAAFVAKHPKSSRASHAQYWLGRAFMAEKSYAQAAKAFLDNYRLYPKGDRAPDSLYWLGQALVALEKPEEACRVYGELQAAYGTKLSATLKDQVTKARTTAKCAA